MLSVVGSFGLRVWPWPERWQLAVTVALLALDVWSWVLVLGS